MAFITAARPRFQYFKWAWLSVIAPLRANTKSLPRPPDLPSLYITSRQVHKSHLTAVSPFMERDTRFKDAIHLDSSNRGYLPGARAQEKLKSIQPMMGSMMS